MDDCRRCLPSLRSSSFSRCWYWSVVTFPGKFISLSVGDGVVWGLGSNRDLFYRHADYPIIFVFCPFLNQFWFKVHFFLTKRDMWKVCADLASTRTRGTTGWGWSSPKRQRLSSNRCWWHLDSDIFCNKKPGWSVRGHFGRVWQGQQPLLQDQD